MQGIRIFTPHSGDDPRALSEIGSEVWSPTVVGRKTYVSNLGRLFTEDRGIWLPEANKATGYRQVYLRGKGKAYAHWLVLTAFEGVRFQRVGRTSKDRGDNRLFNLFWK